MRWVSLYLKWGNNNHSKSSCEDQRRITNHGYGNAPHQTRVRLVGTESPPQTHCPASSSQKTEVVHSLFPFRVRQGSVPERKKAPLWASQEASGVRD